MTLYAGTSGWAYKEWKPGFYPEGLPQSRFLEHYGRALGACEINATFYRRQEPKTYDRWAEQTPEGFRFSTKAHRGLTHAHHTAIEGPRSVFLREFLEGVGRLGEKLGVILFQFPQHKERDDEGLDSLLDALAGGPPFALELRAPSWDEADVAARVARAGGTVCYSETEGAVPDALPPGPVGYVRLRAERYAPDAREGWRRLLQEESGGRDVYVFAKHEGIPAEDCSGGVGLARWLARTTQENG